MAQAPVEQLQAADSQLTRSFVGCVVAVVLSLTWSLFFAPSAQEVPGKVVLVGLGLLVLQLGC